MIISHIEVFGFRSLRSVSQRLESFHVLAGPNGSGKSNFLDAFQFLNAVARTGLQKAVDERTLNPLDLFWNRQPGVFRIAVQTTSPVSGRVIRYELNVASEPVPSIFSEEITAGADDPLEVLLLSRNASGAVHALRDFQPLDRAILPKERSVLEYLAVHSIQELNDHLDFVRSARIHRINLNPRSLESRCPPSFRNDMPHPDERNLPWLVQRLQSARPDSYESWLNHVRTVFPELDAIVVHVREEDKHAYLVLRYLSGIEVPSWAASEGTLRFLGLTVLPYLPFVPQLYLVEEPENGLHPAALDAVYQSLSSVYDGQVLVTTHSPILLSTVELDEVLCFSRGVDGSTDVIEGALHPTLREWCGEVPLGVLFASGVLNRLPVSS
jgi:predicted ATPase